MNENYLTIKINGFYNTQSDDSTKNEKSVTVNGKQGYPVSFIMEQHEIMSVEFDYESDHFSKGKSDWDTSELKIIGKVSNPLCENELNMHLLRRWSKHKNTINATQSENANDAYYKELIFQCTFNDRLIREIVFKNAYLEKYIEYPDVNGLGGTFELVVKQKIDCRTAIDILPYKTNYNMQRATPASEAEAEPVTKTQTSPEDAIDEDWPVTMPQMKAFGFPITSEQLKKLNKYLIANNAVSSKTIAMFMATCGHESGMGKYKLEQGSDVYFSKRSYKKTERGAGYIQITWRATHLIFLKTVDDAFHGTDTASYIAEKYPWESAVWFWTNANKTSYKNLNAYVNSVSGDGEDVFLATQYYVNGFRSSENFGVDLTNIRKGTIEPIFKFEESKMYIPNTKRKHSLPNNYKDRITKYEKAKDIFIVAPRN